MSRAIFQPVDRSHHNGFSRTDSGRAETVQVRIPLNFLGTYFWLVFGSLWLVAGVPFVFAGLSMLDAEQRFAHEAVTVEGKVLTRDIVYATNKDGGRSTRYKVSYRFTAEGQTYEGRDEVDVSVWERLREQGPVSVQYLPGDASRSRLAGTDDRIAAYIMAGMGGAFGLAGGVIVLFDLRGRWMRARLRRDGLSATATVQDVTPTNFRINGVTQWRLHYTFPDYRGRLQTGRSPMMAPAEAKSWKKGDTGRVYYDRRRCERSVWVGRS